MDKRAFFLNLKVRSRISFIALSCTLQRDVLTWLEVGFPSSLTSSISFSSCCEMSSSEEWEADGQSCWRGNRQQRERERQHEQWTYRSGTEQYWHKIKNPSLTSDMAKDQWERIRQRFVGGEGRIDERREDGWEIDRGKGKENGEQLIYLCFRVVLRAWSTLLSEPTI